MTGSYIYNGQEQMAQIEFLKDKLQITIKDEFNNPRNIIWYYDLIKKDFYYQEGRSVACYTGYPEQRIEVRSKDFVTELEQQIRNRRKPFFNSKSLLLLKLIFICTALVALAYFWIIPFIAVRAASRVPVSYEKELGDQMYSAMMTGFTVDQSRTAYLNEFFDELKIPSSYDIKITVVDEDHSNAFAIPGGHIVVFDKVIAGMNTYEELAALLAHEFTHINNRHSTKALFRRLGSSIFLSVVLGDIGTITSILSSNADELQNLSYSRSLEKEADLNGVKLLAERRINNEGFVGLFQLLKHDAVGEPSEWINSHPNIDNRIEYVREDKHFNKNGFVKHENLHGLFLKIQTAE